MEASKLISSPEPVLSTEVAPPMDGIAYKAAPLDPAGISPTGTAPSPARERSAVLLRTLLIADLISGAAGALIAAVAFNLPPLSALVLTGTVMIGVVVLAFFFGLYSDGDLTTWVSGLADAPRSLVAAVFLSWPIFGVAAALGLDKSALVALVATVATAGIDGVARALGRGWVHQARPLRQRTVIVGSGLVAERLWDRLGQHPEFGLEAIGVVDDEVHSLNGHRLNKLGALSDLGAVLDAWDVDRVIVAFSRASHQELLNCVRICRDHRVAIDVVPRLFELLDGARALNQIGGLPLLSIGAPPLTRVSRRAKRGLDLVLSALLLLLLSPVLLAIAVAIKLDSPGPVLFRQRRAGRGATEFDLVKFRSMHENAEEIKEQFIEENDLRDGVMFKIKDDPRITRIGRILRRFSLDELPQLYNVFRGEMSLVGPRPLIPKEAAEAARTWHARRLDLRPGITGLWQVSGRSDLPFQEMVRFDYQYVAGWSLARDLEILLATVPVVLSGRGAY